MCCDYRRTRCVGNIVCLKKNKGSHWRRDPKLFGNDDDIIKDKITARFSAVYHEYIVSVWT